VSVICYIASGAEALVSEEWPWNRKILLGIYQFIIQGKSASSGSVASEYFQETLECSDEKSNHTGEQLQDI